MKCKSIEMKIRREQNRCFKAETFYLRHVQTIYAYDTQSAEHALSQADKDVQL